MATTINPKVKAAEHGPESDLLVASIMMRGNILHYFSIAEKLMDEIIRATTFDSTELYDTYMEMFGKAELPMGTKKVLFKFCVTKFNEKYDAKINGLEHLDDVVNMRNCFAHFPLDYDDEAIKRFIDKGNIRLIGIKAGGKVHPENFTWDSAKRLVAKIEDFTFALGAMQNIINGRKF